MFFKKNPEIEPLVIANRVVPGIHSAFTGEDTTYGEVLQMAIDMSERDWNTPSEKGLAMTLIAIINDFDSEVRRL